MSPDLKDWFERGGQFSTLQAQEMGEMRIFRHLLDKSPKKRFTDIPLELWKGYWKAARLSTDFRESILRYAAYLRALEEMKASPDGRPKSFWASRPEEIMGLKDIKDRAFWLSNDLLGAYDRVSVMGQALREHMFPFWSWKEVNFRRYKQLFKNAADNKVLGQALGRKAVGSLALTPYHAWRIGAFLLRATALWAVLQVWNNLRHPAEEKDLPEEVRARPHIILGRDQNGNVVYFSRLGALGDLLEWFGLDGAPQYIDGWFKGKYTLKEIAREMAKSPANVIIQGGQPFIKVGGELLTRRALFPDAFEPRTIRNRMLHLARSFGLENEYLAISNLPARPYKESLPGLFAYKVDPLQAAYGDIINQKRRFMKKIGKWGEGFWITDRGNALYNARLALRYKDSKSAIKYMGEYLRYGGSLKGLVQSLLRMHPLSGMTWIEQLTFVKSLSYEDKLKLVKALKFYEELLPAEMAEILFPRNAAQRAKPIPLKGRR